MVNTQACFSDWPTWQRAQCTAHARGMFNHAYHTNFFIMIIHSDIRNILLYTYIRKHIYIHVILRSIYMTNRKSLLVNNGFVLKRIAIIEKH